MKLTLTVEIIQLKDWDARRTHKLPEEVQRDIRAMDVSTQVTKSLLWIDGFPARIIDNRAVRTYFPMLTAKSFHDALKLIQNSPDLMMRKGHNHVYWTGRAFMDREDKPWSPTPEIILSEEKVWYVYSKTQQNPQEAEFPGL